MRAGLRLIHQQPSQYRCHVFERNAPFALFGGPAQSRRATGERTSATSSIIPRRSSRTALTASTTPQRVRPTPSQPAISPGLHPFARVERCGSGLAEAESPVELHIPKGRAKKIPVDSGDFRNQLKPSGYRLRPWLPQDTGSLEISIPYASLSPCEDVVTCRTGHKQIASFSWVTVTSTETQRMIYVPGAPPLYRPPEVPCNITRLQPPTLHREQYSSTPYNWKPLFQAVETMRPDFDFDHVDLVISPPQFAELLQFCSGANYSSTTVNLSVINDTLFVDGYKPPIRWLDTRDHPGTYGFSFQHSFAVWPQRLENSYSHTRIIEYKVGPLNCVIAAGVDTCLEWPPWSSNVRLELDPRRVSEPITGPGAAVIVPLGFHTEFPAAEMKAFAPGPSISHYIKEQTWFNRAEFGIMARLSKHREGNMATLKSVSIGSMPELWCSWEQEQQLALQKLVVLISKLRKIVRRMPRKRAFAVRPWSQTLTDLHVFNSDGDPPLEEKYLSRFWRKNREQ